jgi:hypothetical protein
MPQKHAVSTSTTGSPKPHARSSNAKGTPLPRNLEKQRENNRRWRSENPEAYLYARRKSRLKKYGLTPESFAYLFVAQNGLCAICASPPDFESDDKRNRVLHVDHDHETGRVRALLCGRCNVLIGQAEENPALLEAMATYLRKQKS